MIDPNLSWLFWAYGIGWVLVLGYVFWLSGRERSLRQRMAQLRELLEKRPERKP